MTALLISLLLWILKQGAPNRITERNRLKQEADRAFVSRDYALAAALYRQLAESALIPEPAVLFNQAQAYFAVNDTQRARLLYHRLTQTNDPDMAASALSQLGVLTCRAGDSTQALAYFQRALRIVPAHPGAGYNFELLSKTASHPRRPKADDTNSKTASLSIPRQPSSNPATQALPSDQRQDVLNKLSQYNLSPEKARMLLDAMRAEEIQYIQQRRRPGEPADQVDMQQTW